MSLLMRLRVFLSSPCQYKYSSHAVAVQAIFLPIQKIPFKGFSRPKLLDRSLEMSRIILRSQ